MVNSKQKGSRVEREIANWLKTFLPECEPRRTQQYCGSNGTSDLQGSGVLEKWHIECKGTTSARLTQKQIVKWINQVNNDAPADKNRVIFHKANNKEIVAILPTQFYVLVDRPPPQVRAILQESFIFDEEYDRNQRWHKVYSMPYDVLTLGHYLNELDSVVYLMRGEDFVNIYLKDIPQVTNYE